MNREAFPPPIAGVVRRRQISCPSRVTHHTSHQLTPGKGRAAGTEAARTCMLPARCRTATTPPPPPTSSSSTRWRLVLLPSSPLLPSTSADLPDPRGRSFGACTAQQRRLLELVGSATMAKAVPSPLALALAAVAVAALLLLCRGAEARVLLTLDDFGGVGDGIANDTQVRTSVRDLLAWQRWTDGRPLCSGIRRLSWTRGPPRAAPPRRPSSPCRPGRSTRSGRCSSPGPARRGSSCWYVTCPAPVHPGVRYTYSLLARSVAHQRWSAGVDVVVAWRGVSAAVRARFPARSWRRRAPTSGPGGTP